MEPPTRLVASDKLAPTRGVGRLIARECQVPDARSAFDRRPSRHPSGPRRNKSLYRTIRPMALGLGNQDRALAARAIDTLGAQRPHACEDQVAPPLARRLGVAKTPSHH